MFRSFFLHPQYRFFAWLVLAVLIIFILTQVYIDVLFNDWFKRFYDILQQANELGKDGLETFTTLMFEFSYLAFGYITVASLASFIAKHFTFKGREAITFCYLPLWEKLDNEQYEGSSQRIQEDAMRFASIVQGLGLGMLRAIMTLIAFIPILWNLSELIPIFGLGKMAGSMVWAAFVISIGGLLVSFWVGRKLPKLEYNNQKVEAAFRKQLVYGEDNKSYANIPTLVELFTGLKFNYFALFRAYLKFSVWENFYFQTMIIFPYLVAGPSLFMGIGISLGYVTQTAQAFGNVSRSFSYFIDNWIVVNELRSVRLRLKEFEKVIGYEKIATQDLPSKAANL